MEKDQITKYMLLRTCLKWLTLCTICICTWYRVHATVNR